MLSDDEENPNEPDEPDPDALGPRIDVPEPPAIEDVDVPRELFVAFWTVVAMANVAVFGVTVGALVIIAFGEWRIGLSGIGIGLVAGVLGYRRYDDYRNG